MEKYYYEVNDFNVFGYYSDFALFDFLKKCKKNSKIVAEKKDNLLKLDIVMFLINKKYRKNIEAGKDSIECRKKITLLKEKSVSKLIHKYIKKSFIINKSFSKKGIQLINMKSTIISPFTIIKDKCYIGENVIIKGKTTIGKENFIGFGSFIENCVIDDYNKIDRSVLTKSHITSHCNIGPFSNIHDGSVIMNGCVIGNFVEIKNSSVGCSSKIKHHVYLGDSSIGSHVNVGCGVITANYDGKKKNRTNIGNDVFIGSNVTIVAPITIEDHAMIAAGSTITRNVLEYDLAIARSRQTNKEKYLGG